MSHDDFAVEPVPGLPEALPAGEQLLWQGRPRWQALAVRVFHARKVGIYFALLAIWSLASGLADGASTLAIAQAAGGELALGALTVALLAGLARLSARTTVYSITSRRLVLRVGMALPTSFNLPFTVVQSASLSRFRDGTGDIPVALGGDRGISYVLLWPHARPWRIGRPEPMLRALEQPEAVAELLSRALLAAAGPGGGIATPVGDPAAAGSQAGHAAPAAV